MSLLANQKRIALEIQESVKNRERVFLSGRQNGKTRVFQRVQENILVKKGSTIQLTPRHEEDNTIEFVTDFAFPRADAITPHCIMRQILGLYGLRIPSGTSAVIRRFRAMLEEFYETDRVLCLAIDNCELIPRKGFSILKYMNEFRYKQRDIGIALLLAGEYQKTRMPWEFLQSTREIPVGKVDAIEDVLQVIETHFPGWGSKFSGEELAKIQTYPTTLEQRAAVQRAITKARRLRMDDHVTVEMPQLSKVA